MSECIDPIIGKILAGWRYDISGIAPEMRSGYEEHLAACAHCRKWQRLRTRYEIRSRPELVMQIRLVDPTID